ncbi:hypothetical protein BCF55_0567 [Hydrogenivirga caldilitoris]|uniref:Lipoprotein n=1 Tax=Hydrogenivirga caldilitoris TaxID=246264 RepID=A0A497XQ90_9AQUI|nr:hypothetical protein [Hydrogenivirga caldilitoris]RLJ70299.1 hypothetical protein BCF55_0567 [Hydrogenivirga caldilitoris]
MLIKVILALSLLVLFSCSVLVEERRADSCLIVDDPTGNRGTLKVNCPELSFLLFYDNSPDGRDPLILEVKGIKARRLEGKRIEPYHIQTGSYETLSGWAYEEEWKLGNYSLKGFEYYVNGGTACYEEEERATVELVRNGRRVKLLNRYWHETDCGGN